MTTLAITQTINAQTLTWAGAGALWALLRTLTLILIVGGLLAGLFAFLVVFWLPLCQFLGGLALIAAYAWLTYPRKQVRHV